MNNSSNINENDNNIGFLKIEYKAVWEQLHFIHTDRTKYVTVFVSLLAGSGYLFLKALKSGDWQIPFIVAFFSGFFNILFLNWFIDHRVSALIYQDKLNLMRKILWEDSGGNQSIKTSILSVKKNISTYSREYNFYKIIALLILSDFGAGAYILFSHYWRKEHWNCCFAIAILIFAIILLLFPKCCISQIIDRKRNRLERT